MKRKPVSILLLVVAVVCFAVAISYPVQYFLQKDANENAMDDLRSMRMSALENSADPDPAAKEAVKERSSVRTRIRALTRVTVLRLTSCMCHTSMKSGR